jgi:hypothetical protein
LRLVLPLTPSKTGYKGLIYRLFLLLLLLLFFVLGAFKAKCGGRAAGSG